MLPPDKKLKTITMLITLTQSGAMRWVDEGDRHYLATSHLQESALARIARGITDGSGRIYIAEANGIRFRLKPDSPIMGLTQKIAGFGQRGVSIELMDKESGQVMEVLYEMDGLPTLGSLYKIVDDGRASFENKLNTFLGE